MRLSDFDFDLPEELIALTPAAQRDASRLLHIGKDGVGHHQFTDLSTLLREGDLLVLNDTKVIPAALDVVRAARLEGGGTDVNAHLNLLEIVSESENTVSWRAFGRPGKRLKEGDRLTLRNGALAEIERKQDAELIIRFAVPRSEIYALLNDAGDMPLPPYIARKRDLLPADKKRYQTVYAAREGSVAAPTAGLHFTDEIFSSLADRDIKCAHVTLHVGAGTFLPVTSDDVGEHKMHAEWGEVTADVADQIAQAKADGRRIVCVGTTSTRLLESAAAATGRIESWAGETDIFIKPGYDFKVVDALVTNFHLPKSTLLMLISALAGRDRILSAYAEAIAAKYRFFSYGDACLIEKFDD